MAGKQSFRRLLAAALAAACLLTTLVETATAQRRRTRRGVASSIFYTLRDTRVAKELQLTDTQQKGVRDLSRKTRMTREQYQPFLDRIQAAKTEEEKKAIYAEMSKASDKHRADLEEKARQLLTQEQRDRMMELHYRRAGSRAILMTSAVAALKMTDDQKKKVEDVVKQREDAFSRIPRDKRGSLGDYREETLKQVFAHLTPDQQSQWRKMLGAPAAWEKTAATSKSGAGNKSAGSSSSSVRRPAKSVPVGSYVASFDASNASETQTTSQPTTRFGTSSDDKAPKKKQSPTEKKNISFAFANAPWKIVLEHFAKKAGLTLDATEVPAGTFSFEDKSLYSPTQALDVLNGYLLAKKFILVRRGKFLVVHNLENPVPQNIVPEVTPDDLPYRGNNELLRVTFQIDPLVDIKQAALEVQEYQGDTGYSKVIAFGTADRLVVTDIGSRLVKIAALLKDATVDTDKSELSFKAFQLVHISAADAAETLKQQLNAQQQVRNVSAGGGAESSDPRARFMQMMAARRGGRGGRGGRSRGGSSSNATTTRMTGDASVKVNADERTNNVLVLAPLTKIKLAEEIVKSIDVPLSEDQQRTFSERRNVPYFKVYKVDTVNSTEVTKTLTALLPQGSVINEDGRADTIHILGNDEVHQMAKELIREMDNGTEGGMDFDIIPLKGLDPVAVANSLNKMFANIDRDEAPSVEADVAGRQLLVRGTKRQVANIRAFATKLTANSGTPTQNGVITGNVLRVPLQGDPSQFAKTLQQLWNNNSSLSNGSVINVLPIQDQSPIRERVNTKGQRISPGFRPSDVRNSDGFRPRNATDNNEDRTRQPPRRETTRREDGNRREAASRQPAIDYAALYALHTPGRSVPVKSDRLPAAKKSQTKVAQDEKSKGKSETATSQPNGNGKSGITITVQNGHLVVFSQNKQALQKLNQMIAELQSVIPNKTTWTVFYLQAADCTETAAMLGSLFPASSVADTTAGTSLMGSVTGGIRGFGTALADASGMSSLGTTDTLQIIPDTRSNALFVSGSYSKVNDVRQVLKVLDATDIPNSARDRLPRMIPVRYANVNDVAQNIREVFSAEIQPARGGNSSRSNPLAMLMQGGRGRSSRGGRNGGNSRQPAPVQLTLGVDERTGHVLVSCDDALFQKVDQFVYDLDKTAYEARQTTRVIQLEHASSSVVAQTLTAMYPNVSVTVSGGSSNRSNNDRSRPGTSNDNDRGRDRGRGRGGDDDGARDARRLMFMQMMRNRGGGGGDNNNGGSQFGGRGGDRGSSRFGGRGNRGGSPFGGRGGSRRGGGGRRGRN